MTPKKEWESIGSNPINSRTAKDIQSKAVTKDNHYLCQLNIPNFELLLLNGVEAIAKWT
jgi:hypothetical protein